MLLVIPLLDERRCQGARRKAAAFASHERNGREASKGRGSRDTRGMKGWRPSAIPKGPKPVRAFCGRILAGHRIDRPVFFRRSRFPGACPGIRGPWGFPFRAHRLRGRRVGQIRPSVRDLKNGASPSPRLKRQGRTRNEDQGKHTNPMRTGSADAAPWPPSRREAAQK